MPTSVDEATKIVDIVHKYLPRNTAKQLFTELNETVGKHTDNDSLRVTLEMLVEKYSRNGPNIFDMRKIEGYDAILED
jgi:hypothetical protein